MKKILVTGGAGYIGSHNVKLLGELGYDVVIIDNLSTGHRAAIKSGELLVGDLADLNFMESVFKKYNFDAVVHFAGSIVVPESVENPIKYYKNNTENSLNLINLCLKYEVDKFVFSSTAAVYGQIQDGIADETSPTKPINPYGRSKLLTEQMLEDISAVNEKFNYIALRYFNVSGADPDGEIGQAFPGATHLIKVNCEAATGKRESVSIFGTDYDTKDGTGIRDYIHVSDLATAHVEALKYLDRTSKSGIFNCGYGHGFSVKEVIKAVKEISKVDYEVNEEKRRPGDTCKVISKIDKIKEHFNWTPEYDDLDFIVKTAYNWEKSEILRSWTH